MENKQLNCFLTHITVSSPDHIRVLSLYNYQKHEINLFYI